MFRKLSFVALASLSLVTVGATDAFAQGGPQTQLKPAQPQLYLRQSGLLVTQVLPGTTAAQQGLEPGDIIVSVNGNAVRSLADLHYHVGNAGRVAQLGVIDCNTGWLNAVTVYPQYGRIGVAVQPVPLNNVQPVTPIYPPWGGDLQPTPLPLPGGNPGSFPGR